MCLIMVNNVSEENDKLFLFFCVVTLAEEHARKARGYEAKLQEKIQERRQVFEETFKEEIENYKLHGKTQCKMFFLLISTSEKSTVQNTMSGSVTSLISHISAHMQTSLCISSPHDVLHKIFLSHKS